MRGQAELISTVIIVSIAVALALGIIYYLTPLLVQGSVQQQVRSQLAQISGSLLVSTPAVVGNDTTIQAVVIIRNLGGAGEYNLYMSVVALDNTGVPFALPKASYYELNGSVASLNTTTGWLPLAPGRVFNVSLWYVWMFIRNDYYRLADLEAFTVSDNMTLANLGLFRAGDIKAFRVDVEKLGVNATYVVTVFTMVNGEFYEVGRVALIPG